MLNESNYSYRRLRKYFGHLRIHAGPILPRDLTGPWQKLDRCIEPDIGVEQTEIRAKTFCGGLEELHFVQLVTGTARRQTVPRRNFIVGNEDALHAARPIGKFRCPDELEDSFAGQAPCVVELGSGLNVDRSTNRRKPKFGCVETLAPSARNQDCPRLVIDARQMEISHCVLGPLIGWAS